MTSNPQDHSHQTQIYVGHLPRNVTDALIHEIMDFVGKITKITIHQKTLKAYAYVTFETHEEAARAIAECNYTKLNDQPIHVSWYESSPNSYAPDSKIIITNLPPSVDEGQLHEALIAYGSVVTCQILRNAKGESTGRGNVQFESPDDARVAYEALQEAIIDGHQINVDFYKPPDKRQDILLKLPPGVICVNGPEDKINADTLRETFKQYGVILDVRVINGFGVIFFENQSSASRADAEFHDSDLTVASLVKKEIQQEILKIVESLRVFISDINIASEDDVREHLETVGKLASLEIRQQVDGSYTGIAQYETEEARNKAIRQLDRSYFSTQIMPIRILPFFDKRLEHPRVGLLQINEMPCYLTIRQLQEEMEQFGNIIATTIVATTQVTCIGYVLYSNFQDALKAHQESKYSNSFLYHPLQVSDVISAFHDNRESRIIICYNIDQKETAESFRQKIGIDTVDGIWVSDEEGHKTIILSCMTTSGVPPAINVLRTQNIQCDVLGIRIMKSTYKILKNTNFDAEVHERLLYCTGLGRTTTNTVLRKAFEAIGPVESAFVIYSPLNNESEEKGIVLFKESTDAAVAKQTLITSSDFGPNFTISEFRSKVNRKDNPNSQLHPQFPQAPPMPPQFPQQIPLSPYTYNQSNFNNNNNQGDYNYNNNNSNNNNNNNGKHYDNRKGNGKNKRGYRNNHNGNRNNNNNNNRNQQNQPQFTSPRARMISYVKEHVSDNQQQEKLIDEINHLSVNEVYHYGASEYFISVWVESKLKTETK